MGIRNNSMKDLKDYTQIENPYSDFVDRRIENISPVNLDQSVRNGGVVNDLWVNSFIRSEDWSPDGAGFSLDGQTGTANFNTVIVNNIVNQAGDAIGSPSGSTNQVQFNDAGAFGGITGFTFDKSAYELRVGNVTLDGSDNDPDDSFSWAIYPVDATTSSGGRSQIAGQTAAAAGGNGGELEFYAGAAKVDGVGGDLYLLPGLGRGTGEGGQLLLNGGPTTGTANGGWIKLTAANGYSGGSGYRDGDIVAWRDSGPNTRMYRLLLTSGAYLGSARTTGTVATTNATPTSTTALTGSIYVGTNRSYAVMANVSARRTSGTSGAAGDSASYLIHALVKDIAGTVSIVGQSILSSFEDQAAWDVTFVVSGSDILLQVTGAANNNITWVFEFTYVGLGLTDQVV